VYASKHNQFCGVLFLEEKKAVNHNVIIENRKSFTVTGVKEVVSFDDETIVSETFLGRLVIKGEGLHILNFDTSTYDLMGEGRIHAMVYTAEEKSGGLFSRIFR